MELEEERDELRRQLHGTQKMLGFVLAVVGKVEVSKNRIEEGLGDSQIRIEEDEQQEAFVFELIADE